MSGVSKSFGKTRALDSVSIEVGEGETHALIGENGAGKSTLMRILSGALEPDSGKVEIDGRRLGRMSPAAARKQGVSMIYQELNLAPHLSVEENISLGAEIARFGWVCRDRVREIAKAALTQLRHGDIPVNAKAGDLSIAERQIVEIARALAGRPKVLVLDEPTSSLTREDTARLFQAINGLSEQGVGVVYISHFLEELTELCDRYTILRDGAVAGSGRMSATSIPEIVQRMVGRPVEAIYKRSERRFGEPALELRNVSGVAQPHSVSLTLRRGEILGIAGLIGSGRTELLRAIFGLDPTRGGEIRVGGETDRGARPARRIREGVGVLSEDRKGEGLLLNRSLADNLTLSAMGKVSSRGMVNGRAQREACELWMGRLRVKAASAGQMIAALSGGNQQKIAMARLLFQDADVLLLDEPTRGIDVGSKAEIYELMDALAREGKAILFVSSYLPELLGVCDSIAVMAQGKLSAPRPAAEWSEAALIEAALQDQRV